MLPGSTALIPALLQSGFSSDEWTFMGFPPHKKGRSMFIDNLANIKHTIIVYESPHRIMNLMEELNNHSQLQVRSMYLIRELTKKYEQSYRGLPKDILEALQESPAKGEFVLIISGSY